MNLTEGVKVAWHSIRANILRSVLTTLGIVIGITAVIAVVAVGQGGQQTIIKEMEQLGSNLFYITIDWRQDEPPTGKEFSLQDIDIIKNNVSELEYLLPCAETYSQIKSRNKIKSARVLGTEADYAHLHSLEIDAGRFLTNGDC